MELSPPIAFRAMVTSNYSMAKIITIVGLQEFGMLNSEVILFLPMLILTTHRIIHLRALSEFPWNFVGSKTVQEEILIWRIFEGHNTGPIPTMK